MPWISGFKIPTAAAAAAAAVPYCFLFWENRAHALQMDYTHFHHSKRKSDSNDERERERWPFLSDKQEAIRNIFVCIFAVSIYKHVCFVLYTEFVCCFRKLFHMLFDGNVQYVLWN